MTHDRRKQVRIASTLTVLGSLTGYIVVIDWSGIV